MLAGLPAGVDADAARALALRGLLRAGVGRLVEGGGVAAAVRRWDASMEVDANVFEGGAL